MLIVFLFLLRRQWNEEQQDIHLNQEDEENEDEEGRQSQGEDRDENNVNRFEIS